MVEGQSQGHVIRTCFIGMALGRRLGLSDDRRSALFYALLLKDAGCSSNASKMTALFDADDFEAKRAVKTVDWSRLPQALLYTARTVSPDRNIWAKARQFLHLGLQGPRAARELIQIRCERGAEISRLIGFPEETAQAIRNLDEHWDGAGHPDGLKGEEIPLLARICGLAQTAEVFYTSYGPERTVEVVKERRRTWFDPGLADIFLAEAREGSMWEGLSRPELPQEISQLEPENQTLTATTERLDLTARAFARIIDAKSPFTYEHSERVAETASMVSEHMGLPADAVADQVRAGLLHDIGKLGVSNRILDKPGRLTDEEFAKVKRHPVLTRETLSRIAPFENILDRASNHHEKLDGSGYPLGLTGEDLDLPTRILTVADIFDALASDRPYRPGMPMEKVLDILNEESGEKLCPESVAAVNELVEKGAL
ncbi:MAG: HD domain-containing phosphohydrolase [Rubrobacteraceae bacterium]